MARIKEIKGYEKIAAGEIIERPASIIKELVENSLDAGSTQIKIIMKNYGRDLIQVVDNGTGIHKDDILVAFKNHSSSKVQDADSMLEFGVNTFGFRGEALASIAAVSNIEMVTRTEDSDIAYKVTLNNSEYSPIEPTGGPRGTNIKVMNLFYNTPVRLKFLKSNSVELGHVSNIISRFALSHPEVHFQFFHNDNALMNTPKVKGVLDRILTMYGKPVADAMIPVSYEDTLFKITGFIGLPETARSNRSNASLFVNNRWIVSAIVTSLVENAYRDYLMKHQYPFYVLFIELDQAKVDFNIHPTKKMVRFAYEDILIENLGKILRNIVEDKFKHSRVYGIESDKKRTAGKDSRSKSPTEETSISAYLSNDSLEDEDEEDAKFLEADQKRFIEAREPTGQSQELENANKDTGQKFVQTVFKTETEVKPQLNIAPKSGSSVAGNTNRSANGQRKSFMQEMIESFKESKRNSSYKGISGSQTGQNNMSNSVMGSSSQQEKFNSEGDVSLEIAPQVLETASKINFKKLPVASFPTESSQFHDNYIILSTENGLVIFDQHAVHERINYEKTVRMFKEKRVRKQKLIVPIHFTPEPGDKEFVREAIDKLAEFGFEIQISDDEFYLTSIPSIISEINQNEIIDAAKTILEYGKTSFEKLEDQIIDYIACRNSIKAGDTINDKESIKRLLIQLDNCENPFHCAHGRPTMIEISLNEIEKKFKRV